jgi:two-component system sensor histidine kinase KdpD
MAEIDRDFERRPDPDALLALADQDRGGKLCVFLGAAPGVGKTYAMLGRARAAKADEIDIVVGIAETHGRRETAALLEGMEVLPRRKVEYRGRAIEEFDIDAALARVVEAGGEVLQEKQYMGEMVGWVAWFRDTEGNRLGFELMGDAPK